MYVSEDTQAIANELFTEREQLYGKLTPERILELITRPDAKILLLKESTNNYGSFWFITFDIKGKGAFQFYGLGENDSAECFQRDFKEVDCTFANPHYNYRKQQTYKFAKEEKCLYSNPLETFKELVAQHPKTNGTPESTRGKLFLYMENLTDSDDAQTFVDHVLDQNMDVDDLNIDTDL